MRNKGEARFQMMAQCEHRLIRLADRALNHHKMKWDQFIILCAKVDTEWRGYIDMLLPGHDWQPIRDKGEEPIALGIVERSFCAIVTDKLPLLDSIFTQSPLPGWAQVIALDDLGGTIANIPSNISLVGHTSH